MKDKETAETRSIMIALAGSVVLFILQIATYFLTGILLLLAGAFDILSDILISVFLLLSVLWSRKPADEFHMFGHGRSQNVAALVSATILIFVLSLETFRQALDKLFRSGAGEFQDMTIALAEHWRHSSYILFRSWTYCA